MRKGIIVAYSPDVAAGIIQTEDLEPHYFPFSQWLSPDVTPRANMNVIFDHTSKNVRNVQKA